MKEPDIAASDITFSETSSEALNAQSFGQVSGVQPVAGQGSLPGPFPAGMHLVGVAPYVPGPADRLVLYYEWKLQPGESCRVVLGTWPRSYQPGFSKRFGDSKGYAANDHKGAGRESSGLLEIGLNDSRDELWIAAVWVEAEHERLVITNYHLAATTDEMETDAI